MLLMGTILTIYLSSVMSGLVPGDAPSFSLDSANIALRMAAILLFVVSTSMAALGDASARSYQVGDKLRTSPQRAIQGEASTDAR